MACYLTPFAPNDACREEFEYRRRQVLASCGPLVGEAIKLDGRTLVLTFASGERREIVMPRANELPSNTRNFQ